MNIIERIFNPNAVSQEDIQGIVSKEVASVEAYYGSIGGYSALYDGEKTPSELETPTTYINDYYNMRKRAWAAQIKSAVVQTGIKEYCKWVVGTGLTFNSTVNEKFLALRGIDVNKQKFSDNVETQFRLYCKSKEASFDKEMNIHTLASEVMKNAILSGDVLIIVRYKGYQPTVDAIDGGLISTPMGYIAGNGNQIINGVEVDTKGEHIAYHVENTENGHDRVLAQPIKGGPRMAWLMYGMRHKMSDTRGISLLSAVLELDSKLDRYLEASVGAAEENANIPYTFEHSQYSTGENPAINNIAQTIGTNKGNSKNETATLDGYATKIAQTTNKQVYNLPVGAMLKTNIEHSDPNFEKFYTPNAELIFSTLGIPPEVALSKYGGSYSGSRAAIKSWEHTMSVVRENQMSEGFYRPVYKFWFMINSYQNNIPTKGYKKAVGKNDWMLQNAYTGSEFIGQSVPHIDPLKEIKAVREGLGPKFANVPIIDGEIAGHTYNVDFAEILEKADAQLDKINKTNFKENVAIPEK